MMDLVQNRYFEHGRSSLSTFHLLKEGRGLEPAFGYHENLHARDVGVVRVALQETASFECVLVRTGSYFYFWS